MNDKIFYYTSNGVLKNWLKNEKIWATRSVTSIDNKDTDCIIQYYGLIKDYFTVLNKEDNLFTESEITNMFEKAEGLAKISKYISLRTIKNLLFYFLINKPESLRNMLSQYSKFKKETYFCNLNLLYGIERIEISDNEIEDIFKTDSAVVDRGTLAYALQALHPFCICFTEDEDSRFFWESYTDNYGVSLELSKKELREYILSEYGEILINEVIYDVTKEYLNSEDNLFKTIFNVFKTVKTSEDNKGLYDFAEFLYIAGCLVKDGYWKAEYEFRAIIPSACIWDKRFVVKENYDLKYNNNFKTQDYIEINIPKALVKSIRRGPLNTLENFEKEMGSSADEISEKHNIKIYRSKGEECLSNI